MMDLLAAFVGYTVFWVGLFILFWPILFFWAMVIAVIAGWITVIVRKSNET